LGGKGNNPLTEGKEVKVRGGKGEGGEVKNQKPLAKP